MQDTNIAKIDELVILKKFDGDPLPENEFERLTIQNGVVVSHDNVDNGEVTGPVRDNNLTGSDIGTLITQDGR